MFCDKGGNTDHSDPVGNSFLLVTSIVQVDDYDREETRQRDEDHVEAEVGPWNDQSRSV